MKLKPVVINYKNIFDTCLKEITPSIVKPFRFALVLLELKYFMQHKVLNGNIYKYAYISKLHIKHTKYMNNNDYYYGLRRQCCGYHEMCKNKYGNATDRQNYLDKSDLKKWFQENCIPIDLHKSDVATISSVKNKLFSIKIKYCYKTMNYNSTPIGKYNIINFKHWDAVSKKTSNKGLKAISTYTYTHIRDDKRWVFGGFKIDDLKMWATQNGYDLKGTRYGDYGDWALKVLE